MLVTNDKYELPLAVAGSAAELSRKCGVSQNVIASMASKFKHGKISKSRFLKVEVNENE